jgi:hypothetical protein
MKARKKPSRLAKALLKTAAGMRKSGILDRAAYEKIVERRLSRPAEGKRKSTVPELSVSEIRERGATFPGFRWLKPG